MNASRGKVQLDPLERHILELLATGLSTTEVSERTGVPVDQVRTHTRTVIRKLGARSKLEALIIAIRHEIIRPTGP